MLIWSWQRPRGARLLLNLLGRADVLVAFVLMRQIISPIARRRELLVDTSEVGLTRNPDVKTRRWMTSRGPRSDLRSRVRRETGPEY